MRAAKSGTRSLLWTRHTSELALQRGAQGDAKHVAGFLELGQVQTVVAALAGLVDMAELAVVRLEVLQAAQHAAATTLPYLCKQRAGAVPKPNATCAEARGAAISLVAAPCADQVRHAHSSS